MNSFNRYLDNVKADEELKEKTKAFVRESLPKAQIQEITQIKGGSTNMKKMIIAACSVATVGIASFFGYMYYKTPVNYVSLDINPSVELGINAFDQVVTAEAANEDGENLIQDLDVTNMPVEEAIDSLVQEATDQDYIAEDGSTVIAVTAESEDDEKAEELQEKSANGVSLAMSAKNTFAAVYKDCSDLSLRTEAKELGISPGKYKLIKMLQTLDPTITVDQYADAKVRDIIRKAGEIIESKPITENPDEDSEEVINKVKDTTEKVKEAKQKADQNKNKTTSSNTDTTSASDIDTSNTQATDSTTKKNQDKTNATKTEASKTNHGITKDSSKTALSTDPTSYKQTQNTSATKNQNATKKQGN